MESWGNYLLNVDRALDYTANASGVDSSLPRTVNHGMMPQDAFVRPRLLFWPVVFAVAHDARFVGIGLRTMASVVGEIKNAAGGVLSSATLRRFRAVMWSISAPALIRVAVLARKIVSSEFACDPRLPNLIYNVLSTTYRARVGTLIL